MFFTIKVVFKWLLLVFTVLVCVWGGGLILMSVYRTGPSCCDVIHRKCLIQLPIFLWMLPFWNYMTLIGQCYVSMTTTVTNQEEVFWRPHPFHWKHLEFVKVHGGASGQHMWSVYNLNHRKKYQDYQDVKGFRLRLNVFFLTFRMSNKTSTKN